MSKTSKDICFARAQADRRSPRWARIAALSLVLALIVLGVLIGFYYAGECTAVMSPYLGVLGGVLTLAFLSVCNSQTVGQKAGRVRVPVWKQIALGFVMTLGQLSAFSILYLVAREILRAVTLSSGLFLTVVAVSVAYIPVIIFVTWQVGTFWMARFAGNAVGSVQGEAKMAPTQGASSQLIGWRFWLWFATIAAATSLFFGLSRRLAPYPYIGVSEGVYMSVLYVVLFGLLLYQSIALFLRHR